MRALVFMSVAFSNGAPYPSCCVSLWPGQSILIFSIASLSNAMVLNSASRPRSSKV